MNTLRNKVQLIGNLGTDPEIKNFGNNRTMAKMVLATSEIYKDADGNKVKVTQWHNLVAWGSVALIAEKLLAKGNEVAVEGKLTHRVYETKEGDKKYITEIVVSEILLLKSLKKAA